MRAPPAIHARRLALLLDFLPLALLALTLLLHVAAASSATDGSCASTTATSPSGGTRVFALSASAATVGTSGCALTGEGITEADAGAPIAIRCVELTTLNLPPGTADSNGIHLRAYADADSFQTGGAGTPVWEALRSSCSPEWDGQLYCTSDGTATGAPRYGTLRLLVRAVRTSTLAYDVNSEDAATTSHWGVVRCLPRVSSLTDPGQAIKYVGGDSFQASASATAGAYNSGATATLSATCGSFTATLGSVALAPDVASASVTIKGDPATTWPAPCSVAESVILSRLSAVSGFTAQPYARWSATEPTGISLSADKLTASRSTGKGLDRGLSAADCAASVAGSPVAVVNRLESVTLAAHWSNARGEAVPSGRLVDAYPYRVGTTPDAETDFNHVGATAGASGLVSVLATSRATSTSTQNTTAPDYALWLKTYGATRTTAELYNLGGCPAFFDLSWVWTFGNLTLSKQQAPVQNASVFVIGADLMYARAENLTEADGLRVAGEAVTCQRTLPDGSTETAASLGTTGTTGTTGLHQFLIVAPPGTWLLACSAADNGNYAVFVVAYTHASPVSAQTSLSILAEPVSGGFSVNVSVVMRAYDPGCDCPARAFPDAGGAVRLTVLAWNNTTATYDAPVLRWAMNQTSPTESAFFAVVNVSAWNASRPVVVMVSANMTGRAFLASGSYAALAVSTESAAPPSVIDGTLPFFIIMAVGLGFLALTLAFGLPYFAVFTLAATFAGYALYHQAQAQGVVILAGPYVPMLLLTEGLSSIGAAAYAYRKVS